MQHAYLNGKRIYAFGSKEDLISHIMNVKRILVAINTEKILNESNQLREIINNNIGYPDGIGTVLALRRKGIRAIKIPGALLWLDIVKAFHLEKSFYLIGSKSDVITMTVNKLRNDYPLIRILGHRDGYFDDAEYKEIRRDIRGKNPDVVFVALGSPRQEYVMADLIESHPALYMGLGGSFDLYCGKTKPVPEWWEKTFKWEGIYRCFSDIKNIPRWKRQLPALKILYKLLLNKV